MRRQKLQDFLQKALQEIGKSLAGAPKKCLGFFLSGAVNST
jgi:hypothetical protein